MIKREELSNPQSCLNKAGEEEPVFVLRGGDLLAPGIVRQWVVEAYKHGLPIHKVEEAMALAEAMERWPTRKYPD